MKFRSATGEAFEGKHHGSSVCIKVLGVNAERAIRRAVSAYGQTHGLCHSRLVSSYGACAKVLPTQKKALLCD